MKILAHCHMYVPTHNAGAEWMLHSILERLSDVHGHECRVITNRPPRRKDRFGPVAVEMMRDPRSQMRAWGWADVVVTHLDATGQAMMMARRTRKPLVHLVHNDQQLRFHHVSEARAQLVVANSEWIRDAIGWPGRSCVVIPPVWGGRLTEEAPGPHDRVTLINLAWAKGAQVLFDLAERFPDVGFLGVAGSYGTQAVPPVPLPNLEVIGNTPHVASKVYGRTAVLLMPSSYESWGRCAVEAAWQAVPTIGSTAPGLIETGVPWRHLPADAAQGRHEPHGDDTGGYDPDAWADALGVLLGRSWPNSAGCAAYARAVELEDLAKAQVDHLAHLLEGLGG